MHNFFVEELLLEADSYWDVVIYKMFESLRGDGSDSLEAISGSSVCTYCRIKQALTAFYCHASRGT